MARIERKTKRHLTELTDKEWERIKPLLPKPAERGRKPSIDLRAVLHAIRYMTRAGGGWGTLPKDFPPWQTAYSWFRCFVRLKPFRTIHNLIRCGAIVHPDVTLQRLEALSIFEADDEVRSD